MKEQRTRLLHDYSVVGEGVPMMSASQRPFTLDDIVYSGEVELKGFDDKEVDVTIFSWRVIQLNYQDRYVRVRNNEGCEMTVSFAEGCTRLKLYHDFDQLRDIMMKRLSKEENATHTKIQEHKALIGKLQEEFRLVGEMGVPPAPVRAEPVTKNSKPD